MNENLIGNENNIIFYEDENGNSKVEVILKEDNVWLNVNAIANLFKVQRPAIVKHINNIYKDEELEKNSTCSILEQVQLEGNRKVTRKKDYNISKVFEKLREKTRFNDIGSIARACSCVATGDYSFAIFTGTNHKNCDIAASKVIVEESGGKVTDLFGKNQRYDKSIKGAIISNGIVHDEIVKIINQYLDV